MILLNLEEEFFIDIDRVWEENDLIYFRVKKNGSKTRLDHFAKAELPDFDSIKNQLNPESIEWYRKTYMKKEQEIINVYYCDKQNFCKNSLYITEILSFKELGL